MYDAQHKIESARVYGNIHNYAYFFIDLLVGKPKAQRTSVIIDTGSSLCGYPCAGCGHCGRHIDAAFDISKSETAAWVKCNKNCSCKGNKCSYYQGYTEGSSISGYWFTDFARLGDTVQENPPVKVTMGCHNHENKLFYTQKANGIFGLAGSSSGSLKSKPTILAEFLKDREHVNANLYTMCMSQDGGRLMAGGYNSSFHVEPNVKSSDFLWLPMGSDRKFFVVSLQKMVAGGALISANNFGRTIVDSGTTYSYFPTSIYRNLKSKLFSLCRDTRKYKCGTKRGAECWTTSGVTFDNIDSKFPVLDLTISDKLSKWYPRSYLYRRGTGNVYCITFDDNGSHGGTVLGASWMIDHSVIFDLDNRKIGVMDARCPIYSVRPRGPQATDFVGENNKDLTADKLLAASAEPVPAKTAEPEKKEPAPAPAAETPAPAAATAATTPAPEKKSEGVKPVAPAPAPAAKVVKPVAPAPSTSNTPAVADAGDGTTQQQTQQKKDDDKKKKRAPLVFKDWLPNYMNSVSCSWLIC